MSPLSFVCAALFLLLNQKFPLQKWLRPALVKMIINGSAPLPNGNEWSSHPSVPHIFLTYSFAFPLGRDIPHSLLPSPAALEDPHVGDPSWKLLMLIFLKR